jgi:hypothetical protein
MNYGIVRKCSKNNPKENVVETFAPKPTKTLSFLIKLGKSG